MGATIQPVPASAVTAAALPPLPDLSSGATAANGGGKASPLSPLAGIMSGLLPVKSGVDAITAACKQIVQSGTIPGAEQVCGQIVALATALLPMAAQQAMNPTNGGPGGMSPMPPPGSPQPISGGGPVTGPAAGGGQ